MHGFQLPKEVTGKRVEGENLCGKMTILQDMWGGTALCLYSKALAIQRLDIASLV